MRWTGPLKSILLLVLFCASLASPVNAGCVSCGSDGDCYDAAPGFSANCECRIRNIQGTIVCKPSGVCDPRDPSTCDDDPWVTLSPGEEISRSFLARLAGKNPLLAGAVWGATTEDYSKSGKLLRTWMASGEYTGTMGRDGRSFTYRTQVQQTAAHAYSLRVLVEEEGTDHRQEFEVVLLDRGRSGRAAQVEAKGRTPIVSWNARPRE
jgi:hypothetical protein